MRNMRLDENLRRSRAHCVGKGRTCEERKNGVPGGTLREGVLHSNVMVIIFTKRVLPTQLKAKEGQGGERRLKQSNPNTHLFGAYKNLRNK